MEQLIHTLGIDWKILLVQIANFGILLLVLWYFLYKPLISIIELRRTQIIQGVADAERVETAMQDARAKKSDIISEALREADEIVRHARRKGKQKKLVLLKEGQQECERMLEEASRKADEIKREALEESREEIAQLNALGTEKLLREKIQ
jgi:F-type H+-transporting ATPase subunit b